MPGSLALISANFPEKERGRAIGTWSGFTSITAAIGPVLGGWFTQHGSWRWVFFINLPMGLAVLVLALVESPESRAGNQGRPFDWLGGLLAALGFGGIVFALIESTPAAGCGWRRRPDRAVRIGRRAHPSPMIPLHLFRSAQFQRSQPAHPLSLLRAERRALLLPARFDPGAGLFGRPQAGAALLPFILLMFLLSRWSGGLLDRYGAKAPLVVGPSDRRRRVRAVCPAGHRRVLLDHVLPGRADRSGSAWRSASPRSPRP